ncbi:dihydroneopterin aldolase [Hwanghaeella grinnelliae]|uniref:dihydroneopterin aldolase n=1 Tax=Hwanghaeella grinnelliae TaxID=2500179 RepID=UPI0019620321|nr:dihydroneopterin aldolase [Hwanghaeella grinnelliae]
MPDDIDFLSRSLNDRLRTEGECRRLFLRGFVVDANIGIFDHEIGRTQRVNIDVDLYLRPFNGPIDDHIDNVLDYDFVRAEIKEIVEKGHINLQETLAEAIADTCLNRDQVIGVRVATSKLDVYLDCTAVGYEIVRVKK